MLNEIQLKILRALRFSLFGGAKPKLNTDRIDALVKEAKAQTVLPFVFSVYADEMKSALPAEEYRELDAEFFANITGGMRVQTEHGELHEIMTAARIPYVILKGCASAAYYPEPELRAMGDVDFLVHEEDIPRGIKALEENGFHRDRYEFTTNQSAYLRPPMTTWEIHKSPSGIPKGETGDFIRRELSDMIEAAELYEKDGMSFYVPSKYHHGIILLLHMISHMTTTGIGLRHLCDWAVFENSISDEEFAAMYEDKLKKFGIWKFAQTMTLVCEKFLGAPKREWADDPKIRPQHLFDIILDVFAGGNFGHKDENRQREIKYLSDRKEEKFSSRNMLSQALSSLNEKVYANHQTIKKHKLLLPVGWTLEGGKYVGLLLTGKRKNNANVAMLKEASRRRSIYSRMEFFKAEK